MSFVEWLQAKSFDVETITEPQRLALQSAWRAEINPPAPTPAPQPTPQAGGDSFDDRLKAIEAENRRIEAIRSRTLSAMEMHLGDVAKTQQLRQLCESAIADKSIDARAFDLAILRAERPVGPAIVSTSQPVVTETVLEAALAQSLKLRTVEKQYDERTLEAAHRSFPRGISLQELLSLAAERNSGYRGSTRDVRSLCRAAFTTSRQEYGFGNGLMASSGTSTITVPGILSNVGNKFSEAGFLTVEQEWRKISKIKPANDFKDMKTYALDGSLKFQRIARGGEITHGTLTERTYTNRVEMWGRMLGISYQDIRNDDLGAFSGAADQLGRGAGDALNEVFWTEFLDTTVGDDGFAFFSTDHANYKSGSDADLSLSYLPAADTMFATQTKPDGTPLGISPKILLVPRGRWSTAKNLMAGTQTILVSSTPNQTQLNPYAGMYEVVSSVYLQASSIAGSSAYAWYLLADPAVLAAIEVAFLDGVEMPMIESSDFDFNQMGMQMRGTMSFGVRKQEYRAGVKFAPDVA